MMAVNNPAKIEPMASLAASLAILEDIVHSFDLASVQPLLHSCQALAHDSAPLDIAVLGQFKAGKSSLLNALTGRELFPVGVFPATAVITRAAAGEGCTVRVTYLDRSVETIEPTKIADFVTEAGNPQNYRHVVVVDIYSDALARWPGIRLVDTPGLGSTLAHNSLTTKEWLPNVGVSIVAISADRPLAQEDRILMQQASQLAPRLFVVLTKVDLLSLSQRQEVLDYVKTNLAAELGPVPVLPFSVREERNRWVESFDQVVIHPVASNVVQERTESLRHKLAHLVRTCHGYLQVGLRAAQQTDSERETARKAVFGEHLDASVLQTELRLAATDACREARAALEKRFRADEASIREHLIRRLHSVASVWHGDLGAHCRQYDAWMSNEMANELTPLLDAASIVAANFVQQTEKRLGRVLEAFRSRIGATVHAATGVTVSPVAWTPTTPEVPRVPVRISRALMFNWKLAGWLLPMKWFGRFFRRHIMQRVPWEVDKNLSRLTSDWVAAIEVAASDLCEQALRWVARELETLRRLFGQPADSTARFQNALARLIKRPSAKTQETWRLRIRRCQRSSGLIFPSLAPNGDRGHEARRRTNPPASLCSKHGQNELAFTARC